MDELTLSKKTIKQLLQGDFRESGSVLGFHEVRQTKKQQVQIVRVLELDAEKVSLFWENETESEATSLKRIHPEGLFELKIPPRPKLKPYRLKISYKNGNVHIRFDPYYFSTQLTEYDQLLFAEGNHHRIYHRVSYKNNSGLIEALSMINTGYFNRDKPHLYNDLYNSLVFEDKYMLLEDFASYDECRQKVINTWKDQNTWTRMSILNTAGSGKFSSDRTIAEYAKDIWGLEAVTVELQGKKVR